MATLKNQLPPYCVARKQKSHTLIYFVVPKSLQPEGWNGPKEAIARTDQHTHEEIIKRGQSWYNSLQAARKNFDLGIQTGPPKSSLAGLVTLYKQSEYWEAIKTTTRESYTPYLETIAEWSKLSGYPHVSNYTTRHIFKFLSQWKDTPRSRKYYKSMLSRLFEVAKTEGFIDLNFINDIALPMATKKNKKKLIIWEEADVIRFVDKADELGLPNIGTAVLIGFDSGQRWTDVVRFKDGQDYDAGRFIFRTSKTDKVIRIPAMARLKERLLARPDGQTLLTVNDHSGEPWRKHTWGTPFKRIRKACGMKGYTFRQLRNSAAMAAERADLTDAEFEAIFGWPRENVRKMLRDYYADRDQSVADRGIQKLENHRNGTFNNTDNPLIPDSGENSLS